MDSTQWSRSARNAVERNDWESAAHAADTAWSLASDQYEAAEAAYVNGLVAVVSGDWDRAMQWLQTAAETKEELELVDAGRIDAVLLCAEVYRRIGEREETLIWLDHARDLLEYAPELQHQQGVLAGAYAVYFATTDPQRAREEAHVALQHDVRTPQLEALAEDNARWEPLAWSARRSGDYDHVLGRIPENGHAGVVRQYLQALADDDLAGIHAIREHLHSPQWRLDAWWSAAQRESEHPARALMLIAELRAEHQLSEPWLHVVNQFEAELLLQHDPRAALELVRDDPSERGRAIAIQAASQSGNVREHAELRRAAGEWGAGARELFAEARTELDQLIGLEAVKTALDDWVALVTVSQARGQRISAGHVIMTGNPGTGKTTVARTWGKMLYALDLAQHEEVVVVSRADLVAEYVGQTGPRVRACCERAMGGVLFIDEAYTLADDEFGAEALATLLEVMENQRDHISVVIAGYDAEIDRLWAVNPGLRSRFQQRLWFADYTTPELIEITERLLREQAFQYSAESIARLHELLETVNRGVDWANAREMRNLTEALQIAQARRVVATDASPFELSESDIAEGFRLWEQRRQNLPR
jgi:tetratricopeptide (TPR) repeat protein